jgi:hypothetical protein
MEKCKICGCEIALQEGEVPVCVPCKQRINQQDTPPKQQQFVEGDCLFDIDDYKI